MAETLDELMDTFFDTVQYEGHVRPYLELPEIATSEDEPDEDESVALADWDESKHPRDAKGQFTSGSGEASPEGGSAKELAAALDAETRGDPDAHPLTRPVVLMGAPPVSRGDLSRYLSEHGKEWDAAPLPDGVKPGKLGECYKNATMLLMDRDDVDYVEGVAYRSSIGKEFGFMHAWVVDRGGKVIDNTWPGDTSKNVYFGVKYPRDKYLAHIIKTKVYGVLGNVSKNAQKIIEKGGL